MKRLLLAGLIVVMLSPAALAEDLQLTAGTMQLGGVASFSIDMTMPDQGDGETGFTLALIPQFGYFVIDNLELLGRINVAMWFGDLYTTDVGGQEIDIFPKMIGFDLGAKYHIPLGSFVVYAGLMVGMNFSIPDSDLDDADTTKRFDLTVPLGILMPLNSHVALDLGLAVIYRMSLEDNGGSTLNVPIGYLGVQGYF
jgi:opacity protein-like surface antigen